MLLKEDYYIGRSIDSILVLNVEWPAILYAYKTFSLGVRNIFYFLWVWEFASFERERGGRERERERERERGKFMVELNLTLSSC